MKIPQYPLGLFVDTGIGISDEENCVFIPNSDNHSKVLIRGQFHL